MSVPEPKKRGPYAKSAKTRQRAIDAAVEIFSTSGFHGATLTDVAERVGMTLTGLQHHFPDKSSLLAAVLEERDRRSREETPIDPREDATEQFIKIVAKNRSTPLLTELHTVLSAEATSPDHPAHAYFVERYAKERAGARQYFAERIAAGAIDASADPQSLANLLIAVSDGLQLQWLLDPSAVDMEREMRRFLAAFAPTADARRSAAGAVSATAQR